MYSIGDSRSAAMLAVLRAVLLYGSQQSLATTYI